jgi:hypothetical protein
VNRLAIEGDGAIMFTARRSSSGDPRQTNAHIAEISISKEKSVAEQGQIPAASAPRTVRNIAIIYATIAT